MSELFEDVIHPGALETRSQLADDVAEMRDQLHKQMARLQELRVKKAEEPGTPFPRNPCFGIHADHNMTTKMSFMARRTRRFAMWT